MTHPPFPPKPQLPHQIRGLMPADTTGYSPRLPAEYQLEFITRMTGAMQREFQNRGVLVARKRTPTGIELRIKHDGNEHRRTVSAMIADTLKTELPDLGIQVTTADADGYTWITLNIEIPTTIKEPAQ